LLVLSHPSKKKNFSAFKLNSPSYNIQPLNSVQDENIFAVEGSVVDATLAFFVDETGGNMFPI
jgi:hypothetical protein